MGDYPIYTSFRIRYLLDAYGLAINGGIQPVAQGNTYSFSTKQQADQILGLAKAIDPQATVSIKENSKQITGGVIYNYRDDSDPTNLYAFAIIVDRKNPVDGKDQHIEQFCGDLIAQRLKSNRNASTLFINDVGQLDWK